MVPVPAVAVVATVPTVAAMAPVPAVTLVASVSTVTSEARVSLLRVTFPVTMLTHRHVDPSPAPTLHVRDRRTAQARLARASPTDEYTPKGYPEPGRNTKNTRRASRRVFSAGVLSGAVGS